jgi:hypothetical protein
MAKSLFYVSALVATVLVCLASLPVAHAQLNSNFLRFLNTTKGCTPAGRNLSIFGVANALAQWTEEMEKFGPGVARFCWDETADKVEFFIDSLTIPPNPTWCYENIPGTPFVNPSNPQNQYPDCVVNGEYIVGATLEEFTFRMTYYFDNATGDLIGSDLNLIGYSSVADLPANVIKVQLPTSRTFMVGYLRARAGQLELEQPAVPFKYSDFKDIYGKRGFHIANVPRNFYDASQGSLFWQSVPSRHLFEPPALSFGRVLRQIKCTDPSNANTQECIDTPRSLIRPLPQRGAPLTLIISIHPGRSQPPSERAMVDGIYNQMYTGIYAIPREIAIPTDTFIRDSLNFAVTSPYPGAGSLLQPSGGVCQLPNASPLRPVTAPRTRICLAPKRVGEVIPDDKALIHPRQLRA